MNSLNNSQDEIILCARCAWREFCVKKFSFDNTKPIKCPDFSPDLELVKMEKKSDKKKDKESS
ncbi:MAG: hypothetical protein C0197_01605 [Caldimicrobium thiodismutans]|uniref:Uncharacterized protein n=1 Tax=Caldimicrobium thiodismutans TaxID=1653476 RepID=A0A2N7PKQ5_9BACT|nr:MAG: hypothetical protein C0197_01605 [Caldimicrobium thiodismutans]